MDSITRGAVQSGSEKQNSEDASWEGVVRREGGLICSTRPQCPHKDMEPERKGRLVAQEITGGCEHIDVCV